jgi:type IV secretory pathway VirD2 relaxase
LAFGQNREPRTFSPLVCAAEGRMGMGATMGNRDNSDDRLGDFRPRIGRTDRARERVASSPLRIATLVRRGHGRLGGKPTARLPPTAGFGPRQSARRVVVKAHVQKLGGHGAQAAARHLRYIERGGVEKDGSPGVLYGPHGRAARETFEQPRLGERHQFRFIVSPEDARDLDFSGYVRELMKRVECDLGRSLEWAAVNHHDTDHPHAHVIVRGVCREGRQLRMDRAYIARGLRWSAQELATERLGPRLENEIQRTREREVRQERFTSLDREIEQAATERRVDAESLVERARRPEPALLVRRLKRLESLGLAERVAPNGWVLAEDWQPRLRELGERGDILKQMHRALHGGDAERFHVVRPGQGLPGDQGGVEERTLVGRVVRKGLGDELKGRTFYAVIETPTGDAYHLTVAARVVDALRVGDLVSLGTKREPAVQAIDRHLVEVAAAHRGVYELAGDADRRDVARRAARRLRELERVGLVASQAPGQWTVASDLLVQLETRHREAPARYRVLLEPLPLALDAQVGRRGPVWLDTLDVARLATKGFGAEVLAALERRRQALRELGIAPDDPELDAKIRDLEQRTVGREIARQSGQEFLESAPARFRGRLQAGPEGSPYLAVSDGERFVLVPDAPEGRSRTGQLVEVVRDGSGRPVLAEELADRRELARQTAGETFAREKRMTFLRTVPESFVGRVQEGPTGSGHLAVSDGARFVLVPATPEALALAGRTVEVAHDAQGRFVGLRARSLDRGR